MELDCSLPCSQQPATGPYPEPDASSSHLPIHGTKIHSNIIQISYLFSVSYAVPKNPNPWPCIAIHSNLLSQYIRSWPPHLDAVSSIRNPRTRHAKMTGLCWHLKQWTVFNYVLGSSKTMKQDSDQRVNTWSLVSQPMFLLTRTCSFLT
jgi:hypothetical protein